MTTGHHHAATLWAIVIGINYYSKRPGGNLEGCVRDAEHTRLYLEEAVDTPLDVVVLTASTPPVTGAPPPEDPDLWPTYTNINKHLARVIEEASSGDRVYIHYSGHGTKTPQDIALVLLHDDGIDSRYLRSRVLAKAMGKMVEKGLIVTLVLDSCFSGGTLRGHRMFDIGVRSIEYDTSFENDADEGVNAIEPEVSSSFRDAHIQRNWLINPKGYTTLTACGPDEEAFEILANGHRQGALTHFLLRALHTLRLRGTSLTHASLYENVSTNFHALWARQTPMRYGNSNRTIFGELLHSPKNNYVPIYKDGEGRLCLRAGHLHGVHEGDEFFACPFGSAEQSSGYIVSEKANVRTISVEATESVLTTTKMESTYGIVTGWQARQITSLSPAAITVRLAANDAHLDPPCEGLLYVEVVADEGMGMLKSPASCTYIVDVDTKSNYQILDASLNKVLPFLTLPAGSSTQYQVLLNVLQHMGKFKYFEAIENRTPCSSFEASFSLASAQSCSNSNRIAIAEGQKWTIRIRNNAEAALHIGIFNFRPSWEVKCLTSASSGAEFLTIPAASGGQASERSLNIQMKIPSFLRTRGVNECEEVMKFFVARKQTRIRVALPEMVDTANGQYDVLRGSDNLKQFLLSLNSTFRGQKEEAWSTKSFIIHTIT
ncbi:uncharacterized protein EKO05_0004424 [Ascochyta rabiei]|uniref:uncharacterized protein n=1 Tax=Didymella rabiei TaxID=5454 RepID=UPI001900C124|nr:uncharacterized protein EKO05_0004424 [Ascochyta rabiei]UPX13929.1 hypothetical protein EKO05_0004424 [Ascochyta rabiei]